MHSRLLEYLRQMKVAAQQSIYFVNGMTYADFQEDTKTQRAVTMNLVILAEAAAKIEERFRTSPWRIQKLSGQLSGA